MKRFLTSLFLILIFTFGTAGVVHAETEAGPVINPSVTESSEIGTSLLSGGTSPIVSQTSEASINSVISAAPTNPASTDGAKSPVQYSLGKDSDAFNSVINFLMGLFAWLLGVAVLTLDYAVYHTVVKMGSYVSGLSAVGTVWRILRDIGNIALIFGFLAIGISTILNTTKLGWGQKTLPMLLVAAVFLNFSLFISEAVIDTGNLFATEFYKQINGGALPTSESLALESITNAGDVGISNRIMSQLKLATLYGDVITKGTVLPGATTVGFMGIILFMITAFVMFALAFILIARFVALIFIIILSPIGFAGLAIPKLSGLAGQWWGKLFEQTITAPVLLLMLYIALAVITDVNFLGFSPTTDWTGFISDNGNTDFGAFASMMLSFLIAMGLLLAVVVFAKKLSAFGAGWATKVGGMASFGALSLGARATLGSAGNVLASKRMQSWARTGGYGGKYVKRAIVLGGRGLRSSTFDFRNAPGAASGLGSLSINAGKGATITAKQAHEAQYGLKPVKAWFQQSAAERDQAGREIDFKNAQKVIEKEKEALAAGTITQAQYDANVEPHEKVITNALSKMSTKQLEELGGIKKGVNSLVTNLSPQQFEALMKSDKLNDIEKGEIVKTRYSALSTQADRSIDSSLSQAERDAAKNNVGKILGALNKGELESMPANILANTSVLEKLSDKQRDTIADSKERTATEREAVRKASKIGNIEAVFRSDPILGPINAANMVDSFSPSQIAKLHKDILKTDLIAAKFTPAILIAIQEEKKLTSAEMTKIGNAIRGSTTASQKAKDYVTTGLGANLWS